MTTAINATAASFALFRLSQVLHPPKGFDTCHPSEDRKSKDDEHSSLFWTPCAGWWNNQLAMEVQVPSQPQTRKREH